MYVFDLDGTLADCTHRLKYIQGEKKDWDAFHSGTLRDTPIKNTIEILNALSQTNTILIVTGRNVVAEADTKQWLEMHNVQYNKLIMRKKNNRKMDTVIKREWLDSFRLHNDVEILKGVFEDRQSVVDMWREEGLTCYQVAPGNF